MRGALEIYAIYALFTLRIECIVMFLKESLRVYAIYAPRVHTYAHVNTRHYAPFIHISCAYLYVNHVNT